MTASSDTTGTTVTVKIDGKNVNVPTAEVTDLVVALLAARKDAYSAQRAARNTVTAAKKAAAAEKKAARVAATAAKKVEKVAKLKAQLAALSA